MCLFFMFSVLDFLVYFRGKFFDEVDWLVFSENECCGKDVV